MTSKELQDSSIISLASTQVLIEELKQRAIKKAITEATSGLNAEFIAITISMSKGYGREDEIQLIDKEGQIFTYPVDMF